MTTPIVIISLLVAALSCQVNCDPGASYQEPSGHLKTNSIRDTYVTDVEMHREDEVQPAREVDRLWRYLNPRNWIQGHPSQAYFDCNKLESYDRISEPVRNSNIFYCSVLDYLESAMDYSQSSVNRIRSGFNRMGKSISQTGKYIHTGFGFGYGQNGTEPVHQKWDCNQVFNRTDQATMWQRSYCSFRYWNNLALNKVIDSVSGISKTVPPKISRAVQSAGDVLYTAGDMTMNTYRSFQDAMNELHRFAYVTTGWPANETTKSDLGQTTSEPVCSEKSLFCPNGIDTFQSEVCCSTTQLFSKELWTECKPDLKNMMDQCEMRSCYFNDNSDWNTNGCNLVLDTMLSSEVCLIHDLCYITPGIQQKVCDDTFYRNMDKIYCEGLSGALGKRCRIPLLATKYAMSLTEKFHRASELWRKDCHPI